MNILIYLLICDKKISTNIPYKKHLKIRKEHILINGKTYYIKGVHRVTKNIGSQVFYKAIVLESFAKFTGKDLSWSHFLLKLEA